MKFQSIWITLKCEDCASRMLPEYEVVIPCSSIKFIISLRWKFSLLRTEMMLAGVFAS